MDDIASDSRPETNSGRGKRWFAGLYTTILLSYGSVVASGVTHWATSWWTNRTTIVQLAAVNVAITVGTEYVARSWTSPLFHNSKEFGFMVTRPDGTQTINKQSLINILMTFFASLLGGPVYFMSSTVGRFLFFIGFGTFNSVISQVIGSAVRDGVIAVGAKRLAFDFIYNGTAKFMIFELWRKSILKSSSCWMRMGLLRTQQDLFTTLIKVVILNVFYFSGV